MRTIPLLALLLLASCLASGQIRTFQGDESVLYAQTKQINQFFRRFNGEEDVTGKRLYETDGDYRDAKLRKKYLNILFDLSSTLITSDAREVFILDVNNKKNPVFLDFHANNWFAEVSSDFTYLGEPVHMILYFKLQRERQGYKWVLSNVFCSRFARYFNHVGDTISGENFLHPMSHELDFMNLRKMFNDPDKIGYYLEKDYHPDQLAIFLKEYKEGNLKFVSSSNVKFHFFQIPNWYFEVSFFNRNQNNSGWLISNLVRVNDQEKKEIIMNYTHEK
ncbi:MAG: hypothetical protein D4R67_07575 [Bacteroidetes bacterium]|nr:MAG: hypothetical protein D4R67_07575 [Bacteroidota bacterium]